MYLSSKALWKCMMAPDKQTDSRNKPLNFHVSECTQYPSPETSFFGNIQTKEVWIWIDDLQREILILINFWARAIWGAKQAWSKREKPLQCRFTIFIALIHNQLINWTRFSTLCNQWRHGISVTEDDDSGTNGEKGYSTTANLQTISNQPKMRSPIKLSMKQSKWSWVG